MDDHLPPLRFLSPGRPLVSSGWLACFLRGPCSVAWVGFVRFSCSLFVWFVSWGIFCGCFFVCIFLLVLCLLFCMLFAPPPLHVLCLPFSCSLFHCYLLIFPVVSCSFADSSCMFLSFLFARSLVASSCTLLPCSPSSVASCMLCVP